MATKYVIQPTPIQNVLEDDIDQQLDSFVSIYFQLFRKSTSSCSSRYSNPHKEKIVADKPCKPTNSCRQHVLS